MTINRWTKEQLKLTFNLYCQLPFGKLHKGNKEIIELAGLIGRTPSALAMKIGNGAWLSYFDIVIVYQCPALGDSPLVTG